MPGWWATVADGGAVTDYDVVVIGAGFAGMYMLHTLRERGYSAHVFETGHDVGGTWFWNRYPGARCDIESIAYSYSFDEALQQEWDWSERFASQPEILSYANHVADRFDLRRDISFETTIASADFDPADDSWLIRTTAGAAFRSRFLITAVGCLSAARTPDWPGLDSFRGQTHRTNRWPHEGVDFTGRRVGVIGTGSSGIQSIPLIAAQAESLVVFQRTPNFSVPARNQPLDPVAVARLKGDYAAYREQARHTPGGMLITSTGKTVAEAGPAEVYAEMSRRWDEGGMQFMGAFVDVAVNPEANSVAAEFVRDKIRELVTDPDVAQRLLPHDHPIGTKRLCVDTDYYRTYNSEHVSLIDLRSDPIVKIVPHGVQTRTQEFDLDDLVLATGFDAMTGALDRIDIRGSSGELLREKWAGGPRTYLGLATAGFPNLLIITGPGSPSVLSNMIVSIEQNVEWIAGLLTSMRARGLTRVEAEVDAENDWVEHVNEVAAQTLFPTAASWYMGANIPGKTRVFMPYVGGVGTYRARCDEVAADEYRGLTLTRQNTAI